MFVFLNGKDKGKTRIYQQDRVTIGTTDTCDLTVPVASVSAGAGMDGLPEVLATVRRATADSIRLTIKFSDEIPFSINGERIRLLEENERFVLHDGDTINFGPAEDGVELLFHVLERDFQALQPVRSNPDVTLSPDIPGNVHPLTATLFVKELATSLWTEIPQRAKAYTLVGAGSIVGLFVVLVFLNFFYLQQLSDSQEQIRQLQERSDAERRDREAGRRRIEEQQKRLDELQNLYEGNRLFAQTMSEKYAGGVCLIVGVYTFQDPATGRQLRYDTADDANGPLIGDTGELLASIDGLGPVVEVEFSGTGFLVSANTILTNKHVVQPWRMDETARVIISSGLKPKVDQIQAYFPQLKTPFDVKGTTNSDQDDIALCRINQGDASIPILPTPEQIGGMVSPGKAIVLLGFPTGVEGLIERLPEPERSDVLGRGNRSITVIAQKLSDLGAIRPLTTQGIISDVVPGRIVHNAQTTEGGSGGPILDDTGLVVGVNSAILVNPETGASFGGSNFGIPIDLVLPMLQDAKGGKVD